jgi:uncharacterized phiE125 gp8 family phage protein
MLNPYGYPYISRYDATYDPFGTLTEVDSETPAAEPLTSDEVLDHLRLSADEAQINLINGYISAARVQAEILQGRDLVKKQYDLSYDYWPEYRVRLRSPAVSVDSIKCKSLDGTVRTLVEDTDYVVDLNKEPAVITPPWNISWPAFTPWPSSAITIRFTSGYDSTAKFWTGRGALIKAGMLLLIAAWYDNRLPFATGVDATSEYPYAVTHCLSMGALKRAR